MPVGGQPEVALVCPTYNGAALLKQTLPTWAEALKNCHIPVQIIFVDNGSSDDTRDTLQKQKFPIEVVRLESNKGFSHACNRGAKASQAPYLFFINNDIRLPENFLEPLMELLKKNPKCFAVQPRMQRFQEDVLDDAGRYPSYKEGLLDAVPEGDGEEVRPIVFFCGAAFLVSREKFNALGGFDEMYTPFAWEDLDLGYRAVKRGGYSLYCPQVTVDHMREATSRSIFSPRKFKILVWRNKFLFMWRCFTSNQLLWHHLVWLPVKCLKFLCNGRWPYVWGCLWAFGSLPGVCRRRRLEKQEVTVSDERVLNGEWRNHIKFVT